MIGFLPSLSELSVLCSIPLSTCVFDRPNALGPGADGVDTLLMGDMLSVWRTEWLADLKQGPDKDATENDITVHRSAYYMEFQDGTSTM
jgi:hypothetical protein